MKEINQDLVKKGIDAGYRDLLFSLEDTPDRLLDLIAPNLFVKKIKTTETPLSDYKETGIYFFEVENNVFEDTVFNTTDTRFTLSVTNKETECLQVLSITRSGNDDLQEVLDYRRVGTLVDGTMNWSDWSHTVIHWDSIVGLPLALQKWITSKEQEESVLTPEEKALLNQLRTDIDNLNTELSEAEVSLSNQIGERITERLQLYRPSVDVLPVASQTDKGVLSFNDIPLASETLKGMVLINPVENAAEPFKVPSSKAVYQALQDLKTWVENQDYTTNADLGNIGNQLPNYALPIQITQNQNNEGVKASDVYFGLTRLADSIEAGSKDVVTSDLLNSYKSTIEGRVTGIDVDYSGFKLLYTTKFASLEAVVDDLVAFKNTPPSITWDSILNKPTDITFEDTKVSITKPVTIDGYNVITEGNILDNIPTASTTVAGKVVLAENIQEASEKVVTASLLKNELDGQYTKINSIESDLNNLKSDYELTNNEVTNHGQQLEQVNQALSGKADVDHVHADLNQAIDEIRASVTTKAEQTHVHGMDSITGLTEALETLKTEVETSFNEGLAGKSAIGHTHGIGDVTGLQEALDSKTTEAKVNELISNASVNWDNLSGKPSTFTPSSHTHSIGEVEGLEDTLNTKANTVHSHDDLTQSINEVTNALAGKANSQHTHEMSEVNGLQTALQEQSDLVQLVIDQLDEYKEKDAEALSNAASFVEGKLLEKVDQAKAELTGLVDTKADSSHVHQITDVEGLEASLASKADSSHNHQISEVEGLQDSLDGKSAVGHQHQIADIDGLQAKLNEKANFIEVASNLNNLEAKLATKANTSHTHLISDIDGLEDSLTSKANVDHSHTWDSIEGKPTTFTPATHIHVEFEEIVGLRNRVEGVETSLNTKAPSTHTHSWESIENKPSTFTPSEHTHQMSQVEGLKAALDSKLPMSAYAGIMSIIEGLQVNKANYNHTHSIANINGLQDALNDKANNNEVDSRIANLESDLSSKSNNGHTHSWNDLSDKPTSFPTEEHSHQLNEVEGLEEALNTKAAVSHTHAISDVEGLQTELGTKAIASEVNASISELQQSLANKSDLQHQHLISDITGLQDRLQSLQDYLDTKAEKDALQSFVTNFEESLNQRVKSVDFTWEKLKNKPEVQAADWNTLLNKPALFSGSYEDLSNKPELFDGSYNSLTDKPELFSGSYEDLTNKPTLFSGSYNDLTDKPTDIAPTAHTHVIADVNGLEEALEGKAPVTHTHTLSEITDYVEKPSLVNKVTTTDAALTDYTATGIYFFELEENTFSDSIFTPDISRFILTVSNKGNECLQNIRFTNTMSDEVEGVFEYNRLGSLVDENRTWTEWESLKIHASSIIGGTISNEQVDSFDIRARPIYPKMMDALDYLMGKRIIETEDLNIAGLNFSIPGNIYYSLDEKEEAKGNLNIFFSFIFDSLKELFTIEGSLSTESDRYKEIAYFNSLIIDFVNNDKNPTVDKTINKVLHKEDGNLYFFKSFKKYKINDFYTLTINEESKTFTCQFNENILNDFFDPFIVVHSKDFGKIIFTSENLNKTISGSMKYIPLDGRSEVFELSSSPSGFTSRNNLISNYLLFNLINKDVNSGQNSNLFTNYLEELKTQLTFEPKMTDNLNSYINKNNQDNMLFLETNVVQRSDGMHAVRVYYPDFRIKAGLNTNSTLTPYLVAI